MSGQIVNYIKFCEAIDKVSPEILGSRVSLGPFWKQLEVSTAAPAFKCMRRW